MEGGTVMGCYWGLSAEPGGLVLSVEAVTEQADGGWSGGVTTLPFGAVTADAATHEQVRVQLARSVLAVIRAGTISVPPGDVSAVRLFSTSVTDYPRGGARPGPWICVPAVADRDGDRWRAAAVAAAGPLGGTAAAGETLAAACEALASLLMVALEVGIDGMPEGWTGIMLFMLTRKTYPAAMLSAS
jgi:hypothetical protein